jgi:hypothetical protein
MPNIDFSTVVGLEPLPVGRYPAIIAAATEGTSHAGNAKIDLQWKIVGGKYADRIIFDSLVFTPQTAFRVKGTLVQLGFAKNFKGNVGSQDLIGKTAEIVLEIEASTQIDESTGEPYPPRNRVKKVVSVKLAQAVKK